MAADTNNAPATNEPAIKGAEFVKTAGGATELRVNDCTVLTPADYQSIRKLDDLKSLGLRLGPDDASLKLLAGMPALETLGINGSKLTDQGSTALADFPALTTLTLVHSPIGFTGKDLGALAKLPHLVSFSFGGCRDFSDQGMAAVTSLPHLQSLRVWHAAVTTEGMKTLVGMKGLKSLALGQERGGGLNDEAVSIVAQVPSLESLTLSESRLSLEALSKLKQLHNLKNLNLTDVDITGGDIAALKQALPKVTIKWNAPKDEGFIDKIIGKPSTATAPAPQPTH